MQIDQIGELLVAGIFGLMMLLAVGAGLMSVAWVIAEGITRLFPGIRPFVMRRMNWTEYKPGSDNVPPISHERGIRLPVGLNAQTTDEAHEQYFIGIRPDVAERIAADFVHGLNADANLKVIPEVRIGMMPEPVSQDVHDFLQRFRSQRRRENLNFRRLDMPLVCHGCQRPRQIWVGSTCLKCSPISQQVH